MSSTHVTPHPLVRIEKTNHPASKRHAGSKQSLHCLFHTARAVLVAVRSLFKRMFSHGQNEPSIQCETGCTSHRTSGHLTRHLSHLSHNHNTWQQNLSHFSSLHDLYTHTCQMIQISNCRDWLAFLERIRSGIQPRMCLQRSSHDYLQRSKS